MEVQLDRPVLITGAPRSGKTTVHRILERSPEVFSVWEPVMIWQAGLRPGKDDCREADAATDGVRRRIRGRLSRMVEEAGKLRYQDNLAHHALRLPFIQAVVPEARIIHVVRDGRDVVPELMAAWASTDSPASIVRRRARQVDLRSLPPLALRFALNQILRRVRGHGVSFGPRVPGDPDSPGLAAKVAWQWAQMVRIARSDMARLPSLSALEVRFEDIVADPVGQARRLTEFAQRDDSKACERFAVTYVAGFDSSTPKRREPRPEEWDVIGRIVDPLRAELGYR